MNPLEQQMEQLNTTVHKTFGELKETLERASNESKTRGVELGETKEQVERISKALAEADENHKEVLKNYEAMNERIDKYEMEEKERGEALTPDQKLKQQGLALRAMFKTFGGQAGMIFDKNPISEQEHKALEDSLLSTKAQNVTDNVAGGYLAPTESVAMMLENLKEFNPFRKVCTIRQTSHESISFPTKTSAIAAAWVAENATRASTGELTFQMNRIPTHEFYCLIDVSQQMIEDSVFNIEQMIEDEFRDQFMLAEESAFADGDAVGKPEGILTNSSIATVNSGAAAALLPGGLISLFYSPKTQYAREATWLLNRNSLATIRNFRSDSGAGAGTGNYLWEPGLANNRPSTILGAPYEETPEMPDEGAGAIPVAFGDFRRGYMILDRLQLQWLRDPYTQATSGNIRIIARRRVGGQVMLAEAIKTQTCST